MVIGGPTAVGKSALALSLAGELEGEIITADSMQVYRYLDIGTAKPTPAERRGIPHHLIDVVDPDQPFSAAQYKRLAQEAIEEIERRGHLPIVVGGTGFYIKTLLWGLSPSPGEDPAIRYRLRQEAEKNGGRCLWTRLRAVDPTAAARIHTHDLFRIVRALEVWEKTGKPISSWQKEHREVSRPRKACLFGLIWDRAKLYRRVDARVESMFAQGLVEEVAGLLGRGFSPHLKSLQGLGYRQVVGYLRGMYPLDEAVRRLKRDTRRYAKRQITWFKGMEGISWIKLEGEEDLPQAIAYVKKSLESCRKKV